MKIAVFLSRILALVASVAVSAAAFADPPSRVARLGYIEGPVSFSPAGENDWFDARINRPLTSGDRLWSDEGARAELQVGGAMIRMDAGTGASILNMDDDIAQLQLTEGRLNVRVLRLEPRQVFEVDTPNLAFTLREPGEYRIEVDPDGRATTVIVRSGRGEAYGGRAAYAINSRQSYRFMGTGLRDYEYFSAPHFDNFDRWSRDRDRMYERSISARYVSQDVVGYQDLDANGTWRIDATFGNVWVPNRVAAGWAPYRDGHWAWIDPWGWTWIDDAPWGFAVSHYGRWTNFGGTWGWVPGPVRARSYYAPALVVFLGSSNFQVRGSHGNVGGIAWFPLGPRDVYRPSYRVSQQYFQNINNSNTVINNTVINNYYSNTNVTNNMYANRQVPGAVVAVPRTAFAQSQPVPVEVVRVSGQALANEPVEFAPPVAPTERSVHGAASRRDRPPPSSVFERPVVARTPPPPAHVGFEAQKTELEANPGRPLDDSVRRKLKRGNAAPAPVVNVIAQAPEAPPSALPPPPAQAPEQRGKSAQQGKSRQQGQSEQQGQSGQQDESEQPGKSDQQHGQPVDTTPPTARDAAPPVEAASPPQRSAKPQVVTPRQATAPAVPPEEQHGKSEQQVVTPKQATAPAAPPEEQRGKSAQQGKSSQHDKSAQPGKGDQQHGQPVDTTPPTSWGAAPPVEAASPSQATPPEPATPELAPDKGKKKDKKKTDDEPPPEEDVAQPQ
jgi:Family of unknown function (DUF6600)